MERGSAVDLGGIGKGFAAERAIEAMRIVWPDLPGALVDLGGDIAVRGEPPEGGLWHLAVADPRSAGESLCTLALESGGVATSGRDCRRFGPGRSAHHLIDPATGAPARGGPLAVTVVGPDAAWAEAHATALAVTAPDAAGELSRLPARPVGPRGPRRGAPPGRRPAAAPRASPARAGDGVRPRALAAAAEAAVALLAAGCGGGSKSQSASAFVRQVTQEFSRGQAGRLWDELHPADQAVVTRSRYIACQSNEGFGLRKFRVLETYSENIEVGGKSTESTAVSVQVTSDDGITTATLHAVPVAGAWRWVLQPAEYAAYKRGVCPKSLLVVRLAGSDRRHGRRSGTRRDGSRLEGARGLSFPTGSFRGCE